MPSSKPGQGLELVLWLQRYALLTVLLGSLTRPEALGGQRVASLQRRVLHLGCGGGVEASLLLLALGAALAKGCLRLVKGRADCVESDMTVLYVYGRSSH
jgi:hypothetical protein